MNTRRDFVFRLPNWWYILPGYLTLWTVCFSLYSFSNGNEMMEAFGIDTGGASNFVMLNSAARYIALAVVMLFGIWIFRTYRSILLALIARLVMDCLDLWAGLQTGIIVDFTGVVQSLSMFILPNLTSIGALIFYNRKRRFKNLTAKVKA